MAPATKGGISLARQGSCMVLAAKGGIKNGAKGAVPSQRSGTSYLPRAEPSTRPGGVSRSRTEPLAPRAKGPAAPSTLARESGRQPSGILESTAQVPTPHPLYIAIEKFHRFPSRNLISLKSPFFYEYQHFSNYPAGERKIRMAEGRILSIPFSCHLVYDYLRYNILCLYFYF